MAIPTEKAYELLNLPLGASKDAIEQSYKKLAFKWHPEKYSTTKNTQEALKKFKLINIAYRKLIYNERDDKDITLHEMFEQYRQVFHGDKKKEKLLSEINNKNDTTTTTTSTTNVLSNKNINTPSELNNNTYYKNNNNFNNNKKLDSNFIKNNVNSTTTNSNNNNNNNKNNRLKLNDKNNNNDEENYENQYQSLRRDDQLDESLLSIKLNVKSLAIKGNELAKQNEFEKAIEKFTEAIKYDYTDHRLFGNRSYCYDKIGMYQEALTDAEKAICLEPLWPKGYFRKGRSLFGLRMYKEAEQAYEKVLQFENTDDPELEEELNKVRSLQLQEMGFSKVQSENAIKSHVTVQAALESIFYYPKTDKSNESSSDLDENDFDYNDNDSDNEIDNLILNKKTKMKLKLTSTNGIHKTDKMSNNFNSSSSSSSSSNSSSNHHYSHQNDLNETVTTTTTNKQTNEQASTSLWIGNVDPSVTEEILIEMFSSYGQLANVRCLPDKYCAFVNFKSKEDAHRAMQALQGKYLEGQRLLIKYPDNPNTVLLSSLVSKKPTNLDKKVQNSAQLESSKKPQPNNKNQTTSGDLSTKNSSNVDNQNGMKLSGPVNGNECYFWRTTGCLYADKCRYEHIKKNKGIDKKPWHK